MFFPLTKPLPEKYYVGCSGGVDSLSALYWLRRNKDKLLGAIYFNHRSDFGDKSELVVKDFCNKHNIKLIIGRLEGEKPKDKSKEEWWRDQRYAFFDTVEPLDVPIILAHHMNDAMEEYLMACIVRGFRGTIPYARGRCIRPFLGWQKQDIYKYARENNLDWIEDPSNTDTKYKRNMIREKLVPVALELNPGLHKIVKRLIKEEKV